jgi:hypothetical protein
MVVCFPSLHPVKTVSSNSLSSALLGALAEIDSSQSRSSA